MKSIAQNIQSKYVALHICKTVRQRCPRKLKKKYLFKKNTHNTILQYCNITVAVKNNIKSPGITIFLRTNVTKLIQASYGPMADVKIKPFFTSK